MLRVSCMSFSRYVIEISEPVCVSALLQVIWWRNLEHWEEKF